MFQLTLTVKINSQILWPWKKLGKIYFYPESIEVQWTISKEHLLMHFCPNMVWWYFAKIMSASHLFLKLYCNFSKTFIYFSISKSVYELGTKQYFDSRLLPPTKVLFIWDPKFQKFPRKYLNFEFQIIIVFFM